MQALEVGPPVTRLPGDGIATMAAPQWPQGRAATLGDQKPRSGRGWGDREDGGRGRGCTALADGKASPLSSPSLSRAVSKEGPRGHGWPLYG